MINDKALKDECLNLNYILLKRRGGVGVSLHALEYPGH